MEKALKNTIIADKSMEYRLTLKSFFKNQFQHGKDCYLILFSHILYTKRQIFSYIRNSCTCDIDECNGHQFLNFIELIYQFESYSVKKKKGLFQVFSFSQF